MTLASVINAQFSPLQELEFFLRILVASACGACIGIERSKRLKEAGVRTHVIVCCGAALMMIVSKYGFADLMVHTAEGAANFPGSRGADPARVAAQVVSGISFLGAGVIFKHGNTVKGLTTAAGIWATAGIGLAVGSGMYLLGVYSTAVIVFLQYLMHHFPFGADAQLLHVEFNVPEDQAFREAFRAYAEKRHIQVVRSEMNRGEDGEFSCSMTLKVPHNLAHTEVETFFHENSQLQSAHYSAPA